MNDLAVFDQASAISLVSETIIAVHYERSLVLVSFLVLNSDRLGVIRVRRLAS